VRHATATLANELSNKMTVKRRAPNRRTMEGEQQGVSSNTARAHQAPRSSHFANETETHLTKSSPLKKPTDLAAAYGKDAARHTFTTRSQLNSGAFGGAGDQHARAMAFMRLAPWLGVGRLWLLAVARAWVLTRVIVRVCEPCVPPLSLKRSPELFLPVPVKVRAPPARRAPPRLECVGVMRLHGCVQRRI
jgi:hypothetical protein